MKVSLDAVRAPLLDIRLVQSSQVNPWSDGRGRRMRPTAQFESDADAGQTVHQRKCSPDSPARLCSVWPGVPNAELSCNVVYAECVSETEQVSERTT